MSRSIVRAPSGRLRTPWRLLVATVFLLLISVAGSVAFFFIDELFFGFDEPLSVISYGVASGLAIALGVAIVTRALDRRRIREFGLDIDTRWWRDFAVGLALGGGLIVGLYLAGFSLGVYQPRFAPSAPSNLSVVAGFALVVALMCIVGFYEELLFRGYLLVNVAEGLTAAFETRTAIFGAVALSSLVFGVVHGLNPNMTLFGIGTITLAGVALGLGYVLTGRLGLPIGFHITWNLAHFVFGLPVSGLDLGVHLVETDRVGSAFVHGGTVGPEGGILGFTAALVGCFAVVVYGRWIDDEASITLVSSPSKERTRSPLDETA